MGATRNFGWTSPPATHSPAKSVAPMERSYKGPSSRERLQLRSTSLAAQAHRAQGALLQESIRARGLQAAPDTKKAQRKPLRPHPAYAAQRMFEAANSQFTRFQNASTYFGRALR